MAKATAATGAVGGVAQMVKASKDSNAAKSAINEFKFQELSNPYKDLTVSRLGADLAVGQAQQTSANTLDMLQGAGGRALVGGITSVADNVNKVAREQQAQLDQQQKQLDLQSATAQERNQAMIERRQENELQGLGNQLNVANQNRAQGFGTVLAGMNALGQTKAGEKLDDKLGKWLGNMGGRKPLTPTKLPEIQTLKTEF